MSATDATKRRRTRPAIRHCTSANAALSHLTIILLSSCYIASKHHPRILPVANGNVVTWNHGPEDHYFCGRSWDDPDDDCAIRQNCRSGRDEECEGHETHGILCFAETTCDTKYGGAAAFVSGRYDVAESPSRSPNVVNFGTLLEGGLFAPSSSPMERGGPTLIPTEFPIESPPDFAGVSDDPKHHWFCGVGFDDANSRCEVHCPTSAECPTGEICYFGTSCDARTHEPTPPPTRRPTVSPTPRPTVSPSVSPTTAMPTVSHEPTETATTPRPTEGPTLPQPTAGPTMAPVPSPSSSPLSGVQAGFFCGASWSDTVSKCKKRCPSGEDTECPGDETCFDYTGCRKENGYGDDPSQWVPGYNEWGESMAEYVASLAAEEGKGGSGGGGKNNNAEGEPLCIPTEVTITADNWPQEITWRIIDAETGNDVVTGIGDDLTPGVASSHTTCLPSWACYEFVIEDAGGDGLCCEHGNGMYRVEYDGEVIKNGAAFLDDESVEFGCVTEMPTPRPTRKRTDEPTNRPTKEKAAAMQNKNNGASYGPYRCVANPLVDAGYVVSEKFCDRFVDCYNSHIAIGDDWFCGEGETCIAADACGGGDDENEAGTKSVSETAETPIVVAKEGEAPVEATTAESAPRPRPAPSATARTDRPTKNPTPAPTKRPATGAPTTSKPTEFPVSSPPTDAPTEIPTSSPTLGPCGGDPCFRSDHCRSRYGFCGGGEHYCTDTSIWSSNCPASTPPPTPSPVKSTPPPSSGTRLVDVFPAPGDVSSAGVTTPEPTVSATQVPVPVVVTFKKPTGGKGKPSGGKGKSPMGKGKGSASSAPTSSGSKPDPEPFVPVFHTAPPTSKPTKRAKTRPPTRMPTTRRPTNGPTSKLEAFHTFGVPTTRRPTAIPKEDQGVDYVVLPADPSNLVMITNVPTPPPTKSAMQANSASMATVPSKTSDVANASEKGGNINDTNNNHQNGSNNDNNNNNNEYSCTADPCQEETWCRSRYGSCGPGFIYCNSYSTWSSSCPPMAPRPTRTPTPRPTRDPVTMSPDFGSQLRDTPSSTSTAASPPTEPPVLPTLPMPTLPTISGKSSSSSSSSANFLTQSFARPHSGTEPSSDEEGSLSASGDADSFETSDGDAEGEEVHGKDMPGQDATNIKDEVEKEPRQDRQYSGLDHWLDFTESRSDGMTHRHSHVGGRIFRVILGFTTSSLFSWMFT